MEYKKIPAWLFDDIVKEPNDWRLQLYDNNYILRHYWRDYYFIIYDKPSFWGIVSADIVFEANNTTNLNTHQARQFWNAYKKWCALTRNEIKP